MELVVHKEKKSANDHSKKVYALLVDFPPNSNGIRFVQVSLPVVDNDTIPGDLLYQAIKYANEKANES